MRVTLLLLASLLLAGCEADLFSESPSGVCTESGVQCLLPAGPLGVCERSPCGPGASAPCFQCVSQH